MKIRCMICKAEEELTQEKLEKVGKLVEESSLDAVDFLNFLSLLNGKTCTNNKKHKYEFEEGFDKEVHEVARANDKAVQQINNLNNEIKELEEKLEKARTGLSNNENTKEETLKKLKELSYIDNSKLWL